MSHSPLNPDHRNSDPRNPDSTNPDASNSDARWQKLQDLAEARFGHGDYSGAARESARAADLAEASFGPSDDRPLKSKLLTGLALLRGGQAEEALLVLDEVRRAYRDGHPFTALLAATVEQASAHDALGNTDAGALLLAQLSDDALRKVANAPGSIEFRRNAASALYQLATFQQNIDPSAALSTFERTAQCCVLPQGEEADEALTVHHCAALLQGARIGVGSNRLVVAESFARRAIALADGDPDLSLPGLHARVCLVQALAGLGRHDALVEESERAMIEAAEHDLAFAAALREEDEPFDAHASERPGLVPRIQVLGALAVSLGMRNELESELDTRMLALESATELGEDNLMLRRSILGSTAACAVRCGKTDVAMEIMHERLDFEWAHTPFEPTAWFEAYHEIRALLMSQERIDNAVQFCEEALQRRNDAGGDLLPALFRSRVECDLADLLAAADAYDESIACAVAAHKRIQAEEDPMAHTVKARLLGSLASTYSYKDDYDQACVFHEKRHRELSRSHFTTPEMFAAAHTEHANALLRSIEEPDQKRDRTLDASTHLAAAFRHMRDGAVDEPELAAYQYQVGAALSDNLERFERARRYLDEGYKVIEEAGLSGSRRHIYLVMTDSQHHRFVADHKSDYEARVEAFKLLDDAERMIADLKLERSGLMFTLLRDKRSLSTALGRFDEHDSIEQRLGELAEELGVELPEEE